MAEQTKVDYGDGVLRIETSAKNQYLGPSGAIEVTVQPPAGSRVEAKAASAQFRAVGRLGDVAFEGAHGSIEIDEAVDRTACRRERRRRRSFGCSGRLFGPAVRVQRVPKGNPWASRVVYQVGYIAALTGTLHHGAVSKSYSG